MQANIRHKNLQFRALLRDEFSRRCRNNPRYSMRAFANFINIDSSTLSQILAGKRNLSNTLIKSICKKIGVSLSNDASEAEFEIVQNEMFAILADWYHFAILDLSTLKEFVSSPKWISRKLAISEREAREAVERLLRVQLLVNKEGRLVRNGVFHTNYSEGITSAAHKEYQRQLIRKAAEAIDGCPQDLKDVTSMGIAADSRRLVEAKERIKRFRRELCAFLEAGEADSVYMLTTQLFPLTQFEN